MGAGGALGGTDRTGPNLRKDSTDLHRVQQAELGSQSCRSELPLGWSQAGEWTVSGGHAEGLAREPPLGRVLVS